MQVYDAIMPLRVLLLTEKERAYMLQFMDHAEEREAQEVGNGG
jgi:hypothetical protein